MNEVEDHRLYILYLGRESQLRFISNILASLGFEIFIKHDIQGLSGLSYKLDILGVKRENKQMLIVNTGIEEAYMPQKTSLRGLTLAEREDFWRRNALLASYDVKAILEREGWVCDLLFFKNCFNLLLHGLNPKFEKIETFFQKYSLPSDIGITCSSSIYKLESISDTELSNNAISIGACFVTLEDFTLDEVSLFSSEPNSKITEEMKQKLKRLRVLQFFEPPTDEFLLGIIEGSRTTMSAKDLLKATDIAGENRHPCSMNAILIDVAYDDPLAVVVALEKHRLIGYEAHIVHTTQDGRKITQKIVKTPQESFIIKVLKAIRIPELIGAMIKGIKGI
jgi:hypothetical protein